MIPAIFGVSGLTLTDDERAFFREAGFHGFLQIDDHHDTGLHGGAEERDVTDPDRAVEIVAEELLQQHAAAEGKGNGKHDVRGLPRPRTARDPALGLRFVVEEVQDRRVVSVTVRREAPAPPVSTLARVSPSMLLKAKDKPTDTAAEPSPPTAAAKDAAPATASIVAWLSALTVMTNGCVVLVMPSLMRAVTFTV